MVNRCRSAGFLLASLLFLFGCTGKNSSETANTIAQSHSLSGTESSVSSESSGPPYKIMLLGDSITQGDKRHRSYRYFLWKKLIDAGVNADFVGSMKDNFNGTPEWPDYRGKKFDQDHEGHWGWRTDEVLAEIDSWLQGNLPDIALVHLGSNDMFYKNTIDSTVEELKELVARLRIAQPDIVIFLAQVLPADRQKSELNHLNEQIRLLETELQNDRSPLIVVDQDGGFSVDKDTYDGIHPDASGEEKMANKWMEAIRQSGVLDVK